MHQLLHRRPVHGFEIGVADRAASFIGAARRPTRDAYHNCSAAACRK